MTDFKDKAVFLSYASQDAEAAKRIADTLRAAGVEVWFDQNELVGGDAWDAKIRKQIGRCALFVPIISANTQARAEGYFRLEWKLADRRTDLIGKSKAFLLPVCIDDTRDSEADVPDSFTAVQWTRLKGGETTPAFVARVKKLLSGSDVGAPLDDARGRRQAAPLQATPSLSRTAYVLLALAAFAMAGAAGWWILRDRGPAVMATPVLSEARQLTARVFAARLDSVHVTRSLFDANDRLCERAATLAPTDPEVWAAWGYLDAWLVQQFERTSGERSESARIKALRAMNYAPDSFSARLALAAYYVHVAPASAAPQAETILTALIAEQPAHGGVLRLLAHLLRRGDRYPEAFQALERLERVPGYEATAHSVRGWTLAGFSRLTQFAAAKLEAEKSLAFGPNGPALELLAALCREWDGDLEAAKRALSLLPPELLHEDRGAMSAVTVAEWRREPEEGLRILHTVNRDWIAANSYNGPKALVAGRLYLAAKRMDAAKIEFQTALRLVNQRLEGAPSDPRLLGLKVEVLEYLGETETANVTRRLLAEFTGNPALASRPTVADRIAALETAEVPMRQRTAASLRLSPEYDDLRADPRFQAMLARAESDPRLSPRANTTSAGRDNGAVEKSPAADKSVAVLAFANLSDDKANEYFSDGISEELLNVLAKVPGLKVSARTSAFYFKGKEVPVPEIAKQLGVAYVVEGSVRKAGDKVRITAQLIKAADGFHVWSDTFTRDLKDVFAVQDEIAGLIAKNLELKMGITAARPTVDLEAYQEYLAGRAAAAKAGNTDLQEAVRHFTKSVAIEPTFTAAWVQLASAHTQLGRWGGAPTLQSWAAARAAIDRALALEPDSPDVLLALGWIRRTAEWDWRGAEQAFRRSLQLRPNHPDSLAGAAVLLFNIGQTEEAFRLGQQAARLDPLNAATQIDLSIMFYLNHNWREAEQSARRALQLAPGGGSYRSILGWSLTAQGRYDEAEAEIARDNNESEKAQAFGSLAIARGQELVARNWLARLEEIAQTHGDNADVQMNIAWLSVGLGDKDRAFAALERARASRDPSLSWVRNSWYLESLHTDPRWPVFLRKVGLADEQLK